MKLVVLTLFLFISLNCFTQEKPKAIVEVTKMNVVYRGVSNPLTLSMPRTVSFEASAPGLKKLDDYGNYVMSPGSGLTVDIEMKGTLPNGEIVSEAKTLRIKDISPPVGTINRLGCGKNCILLLSKDKLKNAKIDMKFESWLFDWKATTKDFKITEFKISFNDKNTIYVDGDFFTDEVQKKVNSTKIGDIVRVFDIKMHFSGIQNYKLKAIEPITIKIIK